MFYWLNVDFCEQLNKRVVVFLNFEIKMFFICVRWFNMILFLCILLDVYLNKLSFINDICELKQDEIVYKSFVFIQKNIDVFGMDEVRS